MAERQQFPLCLRLCCFLPARAVTYQLVLLPVWTAVIALEGQRALVLVNGQTTKTAAGTIKAGPSGD